MLELAIGYVLDLFIRDPQGAWHPVHSIGSLIHKLDNFIRPQCRNNFMLFYGGALTWCVVEKPTIGDDIHPISKDDIVKTNALLYMTSMLAILMGCALKVII